MPSFLTPDTAPLDSDNHLDQPGTLRLGPLDLPGHFSLQSAKSPANGCRPHSASHASNDSLDESSSQSTNMSVVTHDSTLPNGNTSDTTATSAATQDGTVADAPAAVRSKASLPRKPLPNGNINNMNLPDRTVAQPQVLTNGVHGPNSTHHSPHPADASPKDGPNRSSYASAGSGSVQPSPVEMYIRHVGKGDVVAVDGSSSSLTLKGAKADQTSTTTNGASQHGNNDEGSKQHQPNSSPHRFSSPPVYTGPTTATPTSATLSPPHAPAALKHRHTLEVPKVAPGRGSRDGLDTAIASGRFSPTTATTPGGGVRRASLSLMRRNTRSLQSELPRDEIVPDDDALRWAEAIRQKRASKRKRLEEDDDRVLVGTKVDENHANWVTAYNMLTGIRVSVSRTNAKLDRPLTDADFDAKQKSVVDIAGNELVPSAKYDFKFKDYAPWVFRHLRALFRLDPADYLVSLTGKYILSELGSPGKSGSFFYFSRDYKYIIKTIHHAEHKFLRKILKDYYNHVTENPNTLLSQFYGLHRVKMPYGKKIHFVVMNNLFPPHRDIHQTFDLKGSTIGRDYKEENLAKNPRATLKDLNWLRRKQHLMLGLEKKRLFLEQLHRDVRLLQRLQIMDYSLLIGIHDLEKGNEENLRSKTLKVFNPGGDNSNNEEFEPHSVLMRTPSKLENQRKARELRQMLKAQRPVPVGQTNSKMPDELEHSKDSMFYRDDGGLQATHEDNTPGEEIYYLGVIDCLTHYGMIKKIEHFWKGLSNDRDQISALPPHQYGERFLSFMTGITKSSEEAAREEIEQAEKAQAAAAAGPPAVDQEKGKGTEQRASWSGSQRRKSNAGSIPPAPTHKPPPPPIAVPNGPVSHMSQVAEQVMKKAEHQAARSPRSEEDVPDRVLRTTTSESGVILPATSPVTSPAPANQNKHGNSPQATPHNERRESTSVLPILEEAAEASSTGERSRNSHLSAQTNDSDARPLTPAKDGDELAAGFGNPSFSTYGSQRGRVPLTPPKSGGGHLKPDSADSGYAIMSGAGGRARSGTGGSSTKIKVQLSRESLDKALPPLPK